MTTPMEKLLVQISTITWDDCFVTPKSKSWFGRLCSCGTRKGYSISDEQVEVIARTQLAVIVQADAFLNEGKEIGEREELRRWVLLKAALDNYDKLVGYALTIRPEIPLGPINLPLPEAIANKASSNNAEEDKVEAIDSSLAKADNAPAVSAPVVETTSSTVKQESSVESAGGKRKKRTQDELTIQAAKEIRWPQRKTAPSE